MLENPCYGAYDELIDQGYDLSSIVSHAEEDSATEDDDTEEATVTDEVYSHATIDSTVYSDAVEEGCMNPNESPIEIQHEVAVKSTDKETAQHSASSSLISSVKLACTSILDDMIICKFFIIVSAALHLPISSPVVASSSSGEASYSERV